jgi:hypothetical protein
VFDRFKNANGVPNRFSSASRSFTANIANSRFDTGDIASSRGEEIATE